MSSTECPYCGAAVLLLKHIKDPTRTLLIDLAPTPRGRYAIDEVLGTYRWAVRPTATERREGLHEPHHASCKRGLVNKTGWE